ncbi:MAG: hypothetical protein GF401_18200 [Chitinivibrionales bacterium]|nr:hypothetical protein [Chitinivibrionales bacterium]
MRIRLGRLIVVSLVIVSLFGVLVARLFYIQIIKGRDFAERSKDQAQQRMVIAANRGAVRDCNGRVLAKSMESKFRAPLGVFVNLEESGEKQKYHTVKRVYPFGELAGPVIGYIGRDGYGLSGIEFAFEKYLKGENGWAILRRDGRNNRYKRIGLPQKPPVDGCDVILTIDADIQGIAEHALKQRVAELNARGGMCVVMEPHTGKILAMANEPTFNPNIPLSFSSSQRKNRCIEYNYEPGSTFKVITAAAALQEKVKNVNDSVDGGNGVYKVYDQAIRDHRAFGMLSFTEALSFSSNVCFARIANDVGNEGLYKYAKDFGFGSHTGVQLSGEEKGIVHPVEKWSGRTRVTMAIGQEISVTLLQMAVAFSCVANGGVLFAPAIVDKIVSPDNAVVWKSNYHPVRRVISEKTAANLRTILQDVVEKGTGSRAEIDNLAIGGKTGTSQKLDKETGAYSSSEYWSSFIGFAPVDRPEILCAVLIDEPAEGESGGLAAAPVFRKIISQIISHPQLDYAEKMLPKSKKKKKNAAPHSTTPVTAAVYPVPSLDNSGKISDALIIFEDNKNGSIKSDDAATPSMVRVPDCMGKNARDAINEINRRGLVPYIYGSGAVTEQKPSVGATVYKAEICTLYCSYEG